MNLKQISRWTKGTIIQGDPTQNFKIFNMDSRLSQPGELFFALTAARNGHEFISQAWEKGASGAVVSQKVSAPDKNFSMIQVHDTLQALQNLAKNAIQERKIQVIGITGSIGKTTTKEFLASILKRKYKLMKSEGNFNNHIGVPLSILKLQKEHELAVLEMGMSAPGEIKVLTDIAPPDVSIITNIHPVHMEFFESLDKIALAKKELLDGTKPQGTAVLNRDNKLVRKISKDFKGEKIYFGLNSASDIRAENIRRQGMDGMTIDLVYGSEKINLFLPFIYESYLYNFLAAAAAAYIFSLPLESIKKSAKNLHPYLMRGSILHLKDNITLIDDSYNSNPSALESSLKSIADLSQGRKVAVLGDMLELGKRENRYHLEAGELVARLGYGLLITIGSLGKKIAEGASGSGMDKTKIHSFQDSNEAASKIAPLLIHGDIVLIKGSRGIKTEKIINILKKRGN